MFVTARTDEATQLLGDLAEAATALGLDASVVDDALVVDGTRLGLRLVARAHPTPADLGQVVADGAGRLPALVVADRISDAGRDVLRKAGWGWLDRRGHLRGQRLVGLLRIGDHEERRAHARRGDDEFLELAVRVGTGRGGEGGCERECDGRADQAAARDTRTGNGCE